MANDTRAGLAAYIYTNDDDKIESLTQEIDVGMIGINTGSISSAKIPFGGIKESGFGREGSKYGLEDYLSIKYLCTNQ